MKNIKKFIPLALLCGAFVVSCNPPSETTIDGLPITTDGFVYNFGANDDVVRFTIPESSVAKWSDNVSTSMFTLPAEMAGKSISKVERKGDKIVDLTFSKEATSNVGNIDAAIVISKDAYKGAKVQSSVCSIKYLKSGIYGAEKTYSESELKCTGILKGCTGSRGEKTYTTVDLKGSENVVVKGFKANVSSKYGSMLIGSNENNEAMYWLYDYTLDESAEEYSVVLKPNAYKTIFRDIEKNIKFEFTVVAGYLLPVEIFSINQYFIV